MREKQRMGEQLSLSKLLCRKRIILENVYCNNKIPIRQSYS